MPGCTSHTFGGRAFLYPEMAINIIPSTNKEGYEPEKKKRYTPKPYVMSDSMKEYLRERDMWWLNNLFICEETKQAIRERYGIH